MIDIKTLRVALAHHWFLTMAGGEKVCEAICEILDAPDLYSIVADTGSMSPTLKKSALKTSFIQKLPKAQKYYRYFAALFPLAVESFDLSSYDLVISSDSSVVKGIKTLPETCHICFCHSPMRYAWNAFHDYTREFGTFKKGLASVVMSYLAVYDHTASARVDYFAAPSETSRKRIKKYYRRDAVVIHPPCDVDRFKPIDRFDDYYLFVGRLVGYKMADLAVKAFTLNKKRLLIVGEGPETQNLKAIASKNVEFLGWVPDDELARIYSNCKALIFPGEEDFGIVPVEAQAAGRPVIAYGKGGALETVIPNETGLFFYDRSVESLAVAIGEMEKRIDEFETKKIVSNAARFSKQNFITKFENYTLQCLEEHRSNFS
ncbi:MAG: glycosyltransferase [Desulfomonilaceae bacterium]|jgi:glycosyltransferase involved in cell wall biosynthesis